MLQREKKPVIPQPEPQAGPRANNLIRVALLVNIYVFEQHVGSNMSSNDIAIDWPRKVNCWRKGSLRSEPVFVNVYVAQESISPGWESIPGLLKRSTNTGSAVTSCLQRESDRSAGYDVLVLPISRGGNKEDLIYTEDKPLGRLCKICNTFFYEFRVIQSPYL